MSVKKTYPHHSFLASEPGSHLRPWSNPTRFLSIETIRGRSPTGWSHYVLEPPERALDYLDWINHRYLGFPYFIRRALLPAWLLLAIMEAVARQHMQRIEAAVPVEAPQLQGYAARAMDRERRIRLCVERKAWNIQLMRATRLNSEWLRDRERLLQALTEPDPAASQIQREPVEVRARPWDYLGAGSWRAAIHMNRLLDLQLRADGDLFARFEHYRSAP